MKYFIVFGLITLSFMACKKQTEDITATQGITDIKLYYPMTVGNVFMYRMDSTRLVNYTEFKTAYYLVKDTVAGTFLDGQGRTCYTVFRYITDTLASQPYQFSETHYIVYDQNKIEYVDGRNYRFIPLANPLSYSTTWNGNLYLDSAQLRITDNTSYKGWTYQYTSINQPFSVLDSTYQNSITIQQASDSSGVFDSNTLHSKTYSAEVYAKGVGLVYKEIMDLFFQPPTDNKAGYLEDNSFGVKLRLISHK